MDELAWAAGLFEGEGNIKHTVEKRTANPRFGFRCAYASMTLSTTDADVLRRFQRAINCGTVHGPVRPRRQTYKPFWVWRLHRLDEIEAVLIAFAPYLGERRLTQALTALLADTRRRPRPVKPCSKCGGQLNGSHRSYCKSCFAAYVRARKERNASSREGAPTESE